MMTELIVRFGECATRWVTSNIDIWVLLPSRLQVSTTIIIVSIIMAAMCLSCDISSFLQKSLQARCKNFPILSQQFFYWKSVRVACTPYLTSLGIICGMWMTDEVMLPLIAVTGKIVGAKKTDEVSLLSGNNLLLAYKS